MKRALLAVILACPATLIAANGVDFSSPGHYLAADVGGADALDLLLIAREKQKWEALETGNWVRVADWFDDDFISIAYGPLGGPKLTTKKQSFAGNPRLPPGVSFELKDFRVIKANDDTCIITYRAVGPVGFYATSVWIKRDGVWKTILYQATRM